MSKRKEDKYYDIVKPSPEFLWDLYLSEGSVHRVGRRFGVHGDFIRKILIGSGYRLKNSCWTEDEIATLVEYYRTINPLDFDIATISKRLGRTNASVFLKASRIGLCKRPRPVSARRREKIRQAAIANLKEHGHPRLGVISGPLSEEHKKRISSGVLATFAIAKEKGEGMWGGGTQRQRKSDLMAQMQASGILRNRYSRAKAGKRVDLDGKYFRSSWEANIARYLNVLVATKAISKWEYEADRFWFHAIKRGTRFYTPDFKIWDSPESEPYYWEVKGWMDPKSKTRMARMAKYYPDVKVVVIASTEYKDISSRFRHLIPEWEGK